jgi:hypothetical protein
MGEREEREEVRRGVEGMGRRSFEKKIKKVQKKFKKSSKKG